MIEVEIKLQVENKEKIEHDLQKLGFIPGYLVKESDIYFNSDTNDLRKRDMALRVRCCENLTTGETEAVMTFKGPKLDQVSMTRKELETEISNPLVCQEILQLLGYVLIYPVRKFRQYYHLENVTACVDQVEKLGDFLELEIIAEEEKERENALLQIEEILETLGYRIEDTIRTSYLSMLQKVI